MLMLYAYFAWLVVSSIYLLMRVRRYCFNEQSRAVTLQLKCQRVLRDLSSSIFISGLNKTVIIDKYDAEC